MSRCNSSIVCMIRIHICVSDACVAYSEQRHEGAVSLFAGYCRTTNTVA